MTKFFLSSEFYPNNFGGHTESLAMWDITSLSNRNGGSVLNEESRNGTVQQCDEQPLAGRQFTRTTAGVLAFVVPISLIVDSIWILVVFALAIGAQTLQWILLRGVQRHLDTEGTEVAKLLGVYAPTIEFRKKKQESVRRPPTVSSTEVATRR